MYVTPKRYLPHHWGWDDAQLGVDEVLEDGACCDDVEERLICEGTEW